MPSASTSADSGYTDKLETKLQTLNVGIFISMPKEMRHFAMSKGESIVQVHGMGPFQVNWVNPADVSTLDAPAAKP
jgi:hypothetical protein